MASPTSPVAPPITQTASFDTADHKLTHREEHVLKACKEGNLKALGMVFQATNITAPHPPITPMNASKHVLPQTHKMVEAAVRGHQKPMVEYIYQTFPETRIQGPELEAALEIGNLQIFQLLAKQSQSRYDVIHREFEDRETTLVKACRGQKPSIAFFLLEEGADPNYAGASGELGVIGSPLAFAVEAQDLELVKRLVERGAAVEDWHVHIAVEQNRPHIVKFLANTKEELDLESHLEEANILGHKDVVNVLERRLSNGIEVPGEEKEHHFREKLHHVKHTFLEKITSH